MRLAELDDAAFDAAFGPLDLCGRDPAHWQLLADAVAEDRAPGARSALEGVGVGIAPPARLRPPRVRRPRAWVPWAGAVMALAAALLLRVGAPSHGDPAQLVPRGVGADARPEAAGLEVAVAVRPAAGGEAVRYDPAVPRGVGDTLYIELVAEAAGPVVMRRADGPELWHGTVAAGRALLPVGYALEAGDSGARLVVEQGGRQAVVVVGTVRGAP